MTVTDVQVTKPTVPDSDEGIRIAETIERARLLLTAANSLPAAEREILDYRALHQVGRHLVETTNTGEITHWVETLPAYGQSGVGSLRYTRQRAALLVNIAQANGCVGELVWTRYHYPNPKTSRRNYAVNVWGAPGDVERAKMLFEVLQARLVRDAYAIEMEPTLPPADQTKVRRAFCAAFAEGVGEVLEEVLGRMIEQRSRAARVQERRNLAEEAQTAHHARVGDKETVDSTTE